MLQALPQRAACCQSPHCREALEPADECGSEGIIGDSVFRTGGWQTEAKFDGGLELLGMKKKPQNTIDAGTGEGKFALRRDRESDNRHFARRSHFSNLLNSFDNPLRAKFEAGRRAKTVWSEDHKIKILAAGIVSEFVYASGSGGLDAGAVVADVEHHDFNHVANTAIRIANQKVERFHQFEKNATAWWNGRNACVPARGKAKALPTRTLGKPRKGRDWRMKVGQKCSGRGQWKIQAPNTKLQRSSNLNHEVSNVKEGGYYLS
jgi:hypothetical protein